jgi:hypothetical protein
MGFEVLLAMNSKVVATKVYEISTGKFESNNSIATDPLLCFTDLVGSVITLAARDYTDYTILATPYHSRFPFYCHFCKWIQNKAQMIK